MRRLLSAVAIASSVLVFGCRSLLGCHTDNDCKDDRVCVNQECVDADAAGDSSDTTSSTTDTQTATQNTVGQLPVSACDKVDCDSCTSCAIESVCADDFGACAGSPDCSALLNCVADCAAGDDTCVSNCHGANPGGEDAYTAMITCLSCSCADTCGGCK